jgi:hypothetical protein
MTPREEFAKAALTGQLANPVVVQSCIDEGLDSEACIREIARLSVIAADAVADALEGSA